MLPDGLAAAGGVRSWRPLRFWSRHANGGRAAAPRRFGPRAGRYRGNVRGLSWRWPPKSTSRSEEHTSELQSLMRISYAVFCLKKKNKTKQQNKNNMPPQHTIQIYPHKTYNNKV